MDEKQKDANEIRKLNQQVALANYDVNEKIGNNNKSYLTTQGQVVNSSEYWGDVGKMLHEKDIKHNELQIKFEQEIKMHQASKRAI